jgi:hypothetical protein
MATPAVKVYGWAFSPFVSRPLLALEEAGVDYELVPMSRQAGDHRLPEHLARNVRASRPTMNLFVGFTFASLIGHPSLLCLIAAAFREGAGARGRRPHHLR